MNKCPADKIPVCDVWPWHCDPYWELVNVFLFFSSLKKKNNWDGFKEQDHNGCFVLCSAT